MQLLRFLACVIVACAIFPAHAQEAYLHLNGAVHIHSTLSTGSASIETIARQATERGLDVLVITDDDLLKVEYGLPFLRNLAYARIERAVFSHGTISAYLNEIARVAELFPELVIIDGVESAPFYYWEVDLGERRWTLRSWNKHMIAMALGSAEAYANLPIMGSESIEVWHWSSVILLWPLLGAGYCVFSRSLSMRLAVGAISVVCLINNFPFKVGLMDPYNGDLGPAPYQNYIDYVNAHGGLALWPHPEAKSTISPQSLLGGLLEAASETRPHAEDLVDTKDYTAFSALYADRITATEPGGEWDRVLMQYLDGKRERPVWGTGEIDYHHDEKGRIHDILTIFLARNRTREAVIEAMRAGRMYATRGGDERLVLERFTVASEAGIGVAGEEVVSQGQARISVRIARLDGSSEHIGLRLIRSGAVVADISATTPIKFEHVDTDIREGDSLYYRILGSRHKVVLVSNPIFVKGVVPAGASPL